MLEVIKSPQDMTEVVNVSGTLLSRQNVSNTSSGRFQWHRTWNTKLWQIKKHASGSVVSRKHHVERAFASACSCPGSDRARKRALAQVHAECPSVGNHDVRIAR